MFYCIFKKEFSVVLFYGTQFFSKKSVKNSIHFRKFFQKINVLRFKMVSNGKILKNFDEITYKTPHRLFLENFRKIRKFSKIFEFLTPKTPKNSLFIAFLRKKFWPSVLFYGSKKADFVILGPPLRVGPPKNTSIGHELLIFKNVGNIFHKM